MSQSVSQSVSESVSQWQGHLLSCSGQLKRITLGFLKVFFMRIPVQIYREKYKWCWTGGFWNEKWVETEATPDLLLMSSTIFSSFSIYFPQYFLHLEHIFHNIFIILTIFSSSWTYFPQYFQNPHNIFHNIFYILNICRMLP